MENSSIVLALSALVVATGCVSSGDARSTEKESASYNICLILDGTDRYHLQQAIPLLKADDVMDIAEKVQSCGAGTLWVTFISENSEKNGNAYLKILPEPKPPKLERKKEYETPAEYTNKTSAKIEQFKSDSVLFAESKSERFSKFRYDLQEILKTAYSDRIAKTKNGSDIHGAINLGVKLLKSNPNASTSYLILVSDLDDNVGKELGFVPDNISVICVNQSYSRHKLGSIINMELSSLEQLDFIFK